MSDYAHDLVNYRIGPARLTQFRHQDRVYNHKMQTFITKTSLLRKTVSAMIISKVGKSSMRRIWVIMLEKFIWTRHWWSLGLIIRLMWLQMTGSFSQRLFRWRGQNMVRVDTKQNWDTQDIVAILWSRSAKVDEFLTKVLPSILATETIKLDWCKYDFTLLRTDIFEYSYRFVCFAENKGGLEI